MGCLVSALDVGMVALFATKMDASLVVLGLVMVTDSALFFSLNVIISIKLGWIRRFEHGLFGKFALNDKSIFKDLVKTALVSGPTYLEDTIL